jgi:mannose-1-phosphate guanylyltransferase
MKIIVFAGGVGSRLWPLSRKNSPKQFGKIIADQSMLQIAVHKLFPEFSWKDVYISTGKHYKDMIMEQLPELPEGNIIIEPEMRDVGPAVGLVVARMVKENPHEPIVLLWGADHLVKNEALFRKTLRVAEKQVLENPEQIVFIGQKPRFANQNLGYIEFGEEISRENDLPINEFLGFQYRPPLEDAKRFAEDNHHSWNLGYFATTPGFLWKLFAEFSPEIFTSLE